jgi:hypothetical protein
MANKSLDGVLTKKAHSKETFTEKHIEDLVACSDNDTGYHHFCENFFYIQHPVRGKMLFEPFEYQKRLLDAYHGHRFNVNMLPRQMGKTTCAAGYLLWYAMFHPDQTVLISAHKYSGSQEIMQRIRYAYELCPEHIRAGVINYNKGSIEFDNGSRIVSTTTSISAPVAPPSLTYAAGTISGTRKYKYRYVKSVGGVVQAKSEFSGEITSAPMTNQKAIISHAASADPNATYIEIWETELYTGTAPTIWYLGHTVTNATDTEDDELSNPTLRAMYTEDTSADQMAKWNTLHKMIFYKDRLYGIRKEDASIARYSDIGKPEIWGDDSWVEVRRDDGDVIVIMGVSRGTLYFFKNRSVWSMTGDPDANPLIQVEVGGDSTPNQTEYGLGCTSPRSLVSFGDTLIFYSKVHGVYKLENGVMQCISSNVNGNGGILGIDDAVGGIYIDDDGITYYVMAQSSGVAWVCNLTDYSWVTDTNVNPKCFCVDHRGYLLGGKNNYINRYYNPNYRDDNTIEITKYVKLQWIDLMDNNRVGVPRKLLILGQDMSGFFTISLYNENDQQPYDIFTASSQDQEHSLLGEPSRLCSIALSWQSGEIESMVLRFGRKLLR